MFGNGLDDIPHRPSKLTTEVRIELILDEIFSVPCHGMITAVLDENEVPAHVHVGSACTCAGTSFPIFKNVA